MNVSNPLKEYQGFLRPGTFLGLVAVLFWSTSATVGGYLTGKAYFFEIVLLMQIAALVTLFIISIGKIRRYPTELLSALRASTGGLNWRFVWYMLLFSAGITLYHSCFYYSLQNAPRIPANIINYLWPILLFVSSATVFKTSDEKIGVYEVSLLMLAFFGAVCIAWDFSQNSMSFDWEYGYWFALAAAFLAPIYMNSSNIIKQEFFSHSSFVYITGFLLSIPILVTIAFTADVQFSPKINSYWAIIYLGVASIALAHVAWTSALGSGRHLAVSNLAYLVPVISSALLVLFLDDVPSNQVLFGATMIVLSNILSNALFRNLYAESGAIIVFFYMGLVVYFRTELGFEVSTVQGVEVFAQIFAIISGFLLSRMWAKIRQEERDLIQWSLGLDGILRRLKNKPEVGISKELKGHADQLIIKISDFDASQTRHDAVRMAQDVRECFDDVMILISEDKNLENQKDSQLISSRLDDLRLQLNSWLVSKIDRANLGEIFVIGLLGVLASVFFVANSGSQFLMHFFSMALAGSIAYIVLKIRDYNIYTSISEFSALLIFQEPLKTLKLPYYISDENLFLSKFRSSNFGKTVRIKEGESVVERDVHSMGLSLDEYRRSKNILATMIVIGIGLVIFLLADQKFDILKLATST